MAATDDYHIEAKVEGIRPKNAQPRYEVRVVDGRTHFASNGKNKPRRLVPPAEDILLTLESTTALLNALIEAQTVKGDTVDIEWIGRYVTKKGRLAKVYVVRVCNGTTLKWTNEGRVKAPIRRELGAGAQDAEQDDLDHTLDGLGAEEGAVR